MDNRGILCEASEKGIVVANECLVRGCNLTTLKLEKLLILIHGAMLAKYGKPLFSQNVIALAHELVIKEVDRELIMYSVGFKERMVEYICLLEKEQKIMDEVIQKYGMFNTSLINEIKELKLLTELCYEEGTSNIIPNELIYEVFVYYRFHDARTIKQDENSFQKRLKMQFNDNRKRNA